MSSPLWPGRSVSTWLICLRMNVLWQGGGILCWQTVRRLSFQQSKACLDMYVGRVQIGRPRVGIESIAGLVVTRLVQGTEIIPDLGDVGIQADGARIGVQSISILIDLVVKHANRAPKRGIPPVTVDGLLVGLISLGIFLLRHVTASQ